MKCLRFLAVSLVASILMMLAASASSQDTKDHKSTLLLFPYQGELPYQVLAARTLQEEFGRPENLTIELHFEYMNINRFSQEDERQAFLELLTTRYKDKSIDLVIANGHIMLDYWLLHRDNILPHVPTLFFDIIHKDLGTRTLPSDVIGISSRVDHTKSLDWLLKVRPSINELVIVRGVGVLDKVEEPVLDELKRAASGRVKVRTIAGLPLSELKSQVRSLPENSFVLYSSFFEDINGRQYTPSDVVSELASVCPVPIVCGYDAAIETGTIGGNVYSVENQAREIARTGIRILKGEPLNALPKILNQPTPFIFNHLALQRHGIPLSALPQGSIIKNRQYTAWEQHRTEIILILVVIAGLSMTAVYLATLNRRLTLARRALRELNEGLEEKVRERTVALSEANDELRDALMLVKKLEGFLPTCSFCKKIRDDDGSWHAIEKYITQRSEARFSHSFCPECLKKEYPEIDDEDDSKPS